MERFERNREQPPRPLVESPHLGAALLRQPLGNKGTAFTAAEREELGLLGLLPDGVSDPRLQARRVRENILRKQDPLERYIGLAALQDRNEQLFYRVLLDDLEAFLPIVYTPVVGEACQHYSRIFRRARGLWITPGHRGRIARVLGNAPFEDVRLVVATDNERILGLGDQGAGGMGIPIGKLALYTAAAGIHPSRTLPVSLDVGTDNPRLLEDDLYLGWRQARLRGPAYESLVDEFVHAVRHRFPRALLQWEDFKKGNALRLLERYRHVLPSFNDDIQGTAAVTVAALLAAERLTRTRLRDERILVLGAGAAGIGITRLLREFLVRAGVPARELPRHVAVLDSRGLLVDDLEIGDEYKRPFAWPAPLAESLRLGPGQDRGLAAVVRALKPTVLIGTSGQPGVFTQEIVTRLARHVRRPVILPLSNPTSRSEATPAELLAWTEGRALVATGSPFDPVSLGERRHAIGQANNVFVFPGIGLASIVGAVAEIGDGLFAAAATALAAAVTDDDLAQGRLLPRVAELRRVTQTVAAAVLREARDSGLGSAPDDEAIPALLARNMWSPDYLPTATPSGVDSRDEAALSALPMAVKA